MDLNLKTFNILSINDLLDFVRHKIIAGEGNILVTNWKESVVI